MMFSSLQTLLYLVFTMQMVLFPFFDGQAEAHWSKPSKVTEPAMMASENSYKNDNSNSCDNNS